MLVNRSLRTAKRAKKDEFYTQLVDIENELRHYRAHFKGKVVYCNCDDPTLSNFWKFFSFQFERLELKKLMATCYKNPSPDLFSDHTAERSFYLEYFGDKNDNRIPDPEEIGKEYLRGDGDFESPECIKLLKEADIVVTNPPFSLFREYITQLMEYEKKFLIIGHQNAICYKEIFPLIKENKIWLGYGFKGGAGHFISRYEDYATAMDKREGMIRVSGVHWFTNLEHGKRNKKLPLYKTYSHREYPHYDNYNAIEVSKTKEIPEDWPGYMGVPLTFLDKYNPEQFELVGIMNTGEENKGIRYKNTPHGRPIVNGVEKYIRILIRNKLL